MFIAQRKIKLADGSFVEPGEQVRDAAGWSPVVLRANIKFGVLKEVPDTGATKKSGQPRRKKARKEKAECHGRTTQSKRTRTKSDSS